ncbi:MAG TPA: PAS domain S-box protein [Terriglobales bacterium]|nr:PAS domain S-box protein [Terriglobales bacterium]
MRESEQRFRLVADTAPVLLWMSDTDKLCTYFNKPWLEFTGRSLESELGNGWAEGVHREDWQRCMNTYTQAFDRREQFQMEYRLRRYDGEYRWIFDIGVPRLNQDGSFAGYIGIALDVTERKLAEEKLREYEKAVEGLEEMIVVVDREYRYLIANRRFLNARKMTREQVEGRFANEVLNRGVFEAVVKEKLDECFQGKIVRFEMKYSYPELGERDVLISYFPIEGDNGIDRVACIFQDITDRKRVEEALSGISRKLIEAQEQERVRIARELHDDIGQRLSLLSVALDQVQRDLPELSPEARGRMDDLQQQIGEISTDVQSLSHELHSSKLEYLGLERGMRSWCQAFSHRQGMEIDFRSHNVPGSPPPEISLCFFRVLQEAVHNAAKHSGTRQVQVQLGQASGEIYLIVTDFGKGFDMEAAMQGQGLGLTSMRERVRLVNGAIMIQTKPRGGTTIHVRVPLRSDGVSERAAG